MRGQEGAVVGPITKREQEDADLFYASLGRCIAKWSALEYMAGGIFWRVTGIKREQSKAIFHSAQNWRSATAMLYAAIDNARLRPGVASALRHIVDRSKKYGEFRNIVAHDMVQLEPIWVSKGKHMRTLCLRPHDSSLEPIYDDAAIRRENIDNATANFGHLTAIMATYVAGHRDDQLTSPERLRYLVELLPVHPHLADIAPDVRAEIEAGVEHKPFPA